MRTRRVRLAAGRLAGTVQTVPAAVADRLIRNGDAAPDDGQDQPLGDAIQHREPAIAHRDPVREAVTHERPGKRGGRHAG